MRKAALGAVAVTLGVGCGDGDGGAATVALSVPPRPTVVVPERDVTPPQAQLVLLAGRGGKPVVHRSPVVPGNDEPVALSGPALRVVAVAQDARGGVARVRASFQYRWTCEVAGRKVSRPRVRYFPPPQIGGMGLPPGRRVPTRRERRITLRLDTGFPARARACVVEGETWAEAVNAHSLEAYSDQLRFVWRDPGSGPL